MVVVECKDIKKSFKNTEVLDGLSLQLEEGRVYGLLGRNGVGKTTLMNLLTTRLLPNEGNIRIYGEDVFENDKILAKVCMVSDTMDGLSGMKLTEILEFGEAFYVHWDADYANRLVEEFELVSKKRYDLLSKGQKTAIAIVLGLASDCEITIFDEIYSGLDAVLRKKFYDLLLKDYTESNRTFILSTHLIDEMSKLFSDVVIMEQGKVILTDEVDALQGKVIKASGRKEQLDQVKIGKVLSEETFAGVTTRIIFDENMEQKRNEYVAEGLSIEGVSLQDIFVSMTNAYRRGNV